LIRFDIFTLPPLAGCTALHTHAHVRAFLIAYKAPHPLGPRLFPADPCTSLEVSLSIDNTPPPPPPPPPPLSINNETYRQTYT
jgi:hypothetical protein